MSPRSREVEKGHRPTIPDQLSRLSKSDNIKDIGTWGSCEDSWPTRVHMRSLASLSLKPRSSLLNVSRIGRALIGPSDSTIGETLYAKAEGCKKLVAKYGMTCLVLQPQPV